MWAFILTLQIFCWYIVVSVLFLWVFYVQKCASLGICVFFLCFFSGRFFFLFGIFLILSLDCSFSNERKKERLLIWLGKEMERIWEEVARRSHSKNIFYILYEQKSIFIKKKKTARFERVAARKSEATGLAKCRVTQTKLSSILKLWSLHSLLKRKEGTISVAIALKYAVQILARFLNSISEWIVIPAFI